MSNGGRNPSGHIENKIVRLLERYKQATNPKKKRHNLRMIEKACYHERKRLLPETVKHDYEMEMDYLRARTESLLKLPIWWIERFK